MATEKTITANASGRKLTLGELKAFVADMDAAGSVDTTPIDGRVGWGSGLKQVKATVRHLGDPLTVEAELLNKKWMP